MNKNKIACCVILYNPDKNVYNNILSYINSVDMLYVVDNGNGKKITEKLKNSYKNIIELAYPENMGIAKPLNDVLEMVANNYSYLLTMDQDSRFIGNSINAYINSIQNIEWSNTLGISPVFVYDRNYSEKDFSNNLQIKQIPMVFTSGNLISVDNARKIGGFCEDLFIDEVDNEFCIRGYLQGLFSYQYTEGVYMLHSLGSPKSVKILWQTYHPLSHNYIRTYYIFRNKVYVFCKYRHKIKKIWYWYYVRPFLRMFISKCLFEDDKLRKVKSIFSGISDALNGIMGKKNFDY